MKKIYIILLPLLLSFGGCTNYLELNPESQANGEQIWKTAEGCRQMLSGGYSLFRKTMLHDNPFYVYGDLPSDCVLKANEWNWLSIHEGKWDGSYSAYLSYTANWTSFYQVITTVNTLLKHIDAVEAREFNKDAEEGDKEKRQIAAEANFLYAYANFWLVRIWNDVPLVKEAFESVDQAMQDGSTIGRAQSDPKEVLEYSLKRLDAAIVNLEYNTPGDDNWGVRADKGAALALKGHICMWLAYLYDGATKATDYLKTADECLDMVITLGNRELVDYSDANEVYNMFEGKGKEAVFELNVSIDQNESFWLNYPNRQVHCKTYWREEFKNKIGVDRLIVADATWSTDLYDEIDIRRNLFFENFGNGNTDAVVPPVMLKYSTGLQKDPNDENQYFANSNVALMRLTDVYLLRAEALCKLGRNGQARQLLNVIRKRAGIGNYSGSDADLKAAIFNERARELVGEGHSAFDRIRNNYWEGCTWANTERLQKKGCFWPIDIPNLYSSNRALKQNPWWQGKI